MPLRGNSELILCMWLGSSWWCEPVHRALPDHGCRRYRSFLPFRRNSLLEALSRLRRAPAFPFPASLWLKWPFTWRSNVVCNRRHQSPYITTHQTAKLSNAKSSVLSQTTTQSLKLSTPNILQCEYFEYFSSWWVFCGQPTLQRNLQAFADQCGDPCMGKCRYAMKPGSLVFSHNNVAWISTGHHTVLGNFSRQWEHHVTRRNYSAARRSGQTGLTVSD